MRSTLLAVLLLLTACADPAPGTEPAAASDPCAAAAAHLTDCAGDLPALDWSACDPAEAERMLALDCATLRGAVANPKADGAGPVAAFACRLGFYAACEVPACESATPAPPADAACDAWFAADDCGLCEYYRCREALQPCGPDGYLLGYVGKYCDRFARVTEPKVSPRASAWLKRVRRCLVEYLEAEVPYDADCAEVDRRGTDSHTQCYVETGFCELSPLDWFAIIHTIDVGDVPLRVLLRTAHGCVGEWFGPDP